MIVFQLFACSMRQTHFIDTRVASIFSLSTEWIKWTHFSGTVRRDPLHFESPVHVRNRCDYGYSAMRPCSRKSLRIRLSVLSWSLETGCSAVAEGLYATMYLHKGLLLHLSFLSHQQLHSGATPKPFTNTVHTQRWQQPLENRAAGHGD